MARHPLRNLYFSLTLLAVLASAACVRTAADADATSASSLPALGDPAAGLEEALTEQACPPIRVVVFLDKTGSSKETITPQPGVAPFEALLDGLRRRGGELAVGAICAQSDLPLVRVRVPEPVSPLPASEPPRNMFARTEWNKKRAAEAADLEARRLARDEQIDRAFEDFRARLVELADRQPACRNTDAWGALRRANLFLGEPPVGWNPSRTPGLFAVFVSDNQDNVRGRKTDPASGATVVVVNGVASLGIFDDLEPRPVLFDAPEPAFGFVAHCQRPDRASRE